VTGDRLTIEQTIPTRTHGRYLVTPAEDAPAPFLVGFHGYGESAELQLGRLRAIPGSDHWTLVAVQGLHRYYLRRSQDVVASWMTRQDRELAIADNLAYVAAVVEAEWPVRRGSGALVFAGFSQGVAMAFRAAAASDRPVAGVVSVGGDVPPELDRAALGRLKRVLVCRGLHDEWYTSQKFEEDQARLREARVNLTALEFDGGHEWSGDVLQAASALLRELRA
jgi:predicted esterase